MHVNFQVMHTFMCSFALIISVCILISPYLRAIPVFGQYLGMTLQQIFYVSDSEIMLCSSAPALLVMPLNF